MANYGESLISKMIDDNSLVALTKYGIEREHFATSCEQDAYDFIVKYSQENGDQAPSYATLVGEIDGFTYIPSVTDSYEFLAREMKDSAGKRQIAEFLNGKGLSEQFANKSTGEFADLLITKLESVKMGTGVRVTVGKDLGELGKDFIEEYRKRKAGKSFKLWRTPFESLNEQIGGFYSGDIYGVMAESGRGKTYLIEVFVDELLRQGANILVKSYELKAYPWLSRLFSIITAREGTLTHSDYSEKVGIPNKAILSGRLDGEIEEHFIELVEVINEYYPGKLYLQAKSDDNLTRSLDELDRELLQQPDIDVVVIDPFYGLSDVYGRNTNRTTGGAAEQAARRFEQIIGKHDVVGLFAIQAHSERQNTEEGERREIKLPKRDQVKTTTAVLEIATNLFAFDAADGNGMLGVEKGRNGGEGFTIPLIALMNYGVLRELPRGEAVAAQFVSNF